MGEVAQHSFQKKRDGYKKQGKSLVYLDERGFAKDIAAIIAYWRTYVRTATAGD
ncbi:hypothetical protein [Candidatus Fukatsuia symbiotica]|uniref:hypothetical protein n=1 Tax=Candidatus Fukatsuia symbiotica TaxID=1878942 RepID=UPI0013C2EFBC|nr:hypothetical protein [Candidatus Fukatsuia symbiotica]